MAPRRDGHCVLLSVLLLLSYSLFATAVRIYAVFVAEFCKRDFVVVAKLLQGFISTSLGEEFPPSVYPPPQRPLLFPAVKTITFDFLTVNLVSYTKIIIQHHQMHNNPAGDAHSATPDL